MVAAEKFKAPEPSPATGDLPSTVAQTIQEESDEEVIVCVCVRFAVAVCACVMYVIVWNVTQNNTHLII